MTNSLDIKARRALTSVEGTFLSLMEEEDGDPTEVFDEIYSIIPSDEGEVEVSLRLNGPDLIFSPGGKTLFHFSSGGEWADIDVSGRSWAIWLREFLKREGQIQ